MKKDSFLEVGSLRDVSKQSLRIFIWSLPLSIVAIAPLYMLHIVEFNVVDFLKMSSIAGIRACLMYIAIISVKFLFKNRKSKKI